MFHICGYLWRVQIFLWLFMESINIFVVIYGKCKYFCGYLWRVQICLWLFMESVNIFVVIY